MAERSARKLRSYLTELGFRSEGKNVFNFQNRKNTHKNKVESANSKSESVWVVKRWTLTLQGSKLTTKDLELEADIDRIARALENVVRKQFPSTERVDIRPAKTSGGVWCFVEFRKTNAGDTERGIVGFRFYFTFGAKQMSVRVADRFALGPFVPASCMRSVTKIIQSALGLEPINRLTLHGITADLEKIAGLQVGWDSQVEQPWRNSSAEFYVKQTRKSIAIGYANNLAMGSRGYPEADVQMLEDRLLLEQFSELESCLVSGSDAKVGATLKRHLDLTPDQLFTIRRALLVPETAKLISSATLKQCLANEPDNLLFVCAAVNSSLDKAQYKEALHGLSNTVRAVENDVDNVDTITGLAFVVSGLLAKAWWEIDLTKAELCLKRQLSIAPDDIPTMSKLADCYRKMGNRDLELQVLEKLVDQQTDNAQSARIHYLLAQHYVQTENGQERAIEHAKRSLSKDPAYLPAATFLADILLDHGKAPEAVMVLNEVAVSDSLTELERARMETKLGRIWFDVLSRPDLARLHFERATELDERNLEVLSYLEKILRSTDEHDRLVDVLNAQYRILEESGARHDLESVREAIARVYSTALGELDKAIDLYLQSASGIDLREPDELASLFGFSTDKVDWRALYEGLTARVHEVSPGKPRALLHVNLAKLAKEKLNERAVAAKHFEKATHEGWIDTQSFEFLSEFLKERQRRDTLVRLTLLRVDQVADEQKPDLLKQAILLGELLKDQELDDLIVKLFSINTGDHRYLFKRIDEYGNKGDVGRIRDLLGRILEVTGEGVAANVWIDLCIENIAKSKQELSFVVIDELFKLRTIDSEDEVPILQSAIRILSDSGRKELLTYYVERILMLGGVPEHEDRDLILSLIGKPRMRASYLELLAESAQSDSECAELYRRVLDEFRKLPDSNDDVERCLGMICLKTPAETHELEQLREQINRSGRWSDFARVLRFQVDQNAKPLVRYELLNELSDIYWAKLDQADDAIAALLEALEVSPDIESTRFKLIMILQDAKKEDLERDQLAAYLQDERCVTNINNFGQLLERMVTYYDMAGEVEGNLRTHIENLTSKGDANLASQLSDLLIDHGMGEKDLRRGSFVGAVQRSDSAKATAIWVALLEDLPSHDDVEKLIGWTKQTLADHFTDIMLEELLAEVVDILDNADLSNKVYYEFHYHAGLALLNSDEFNAVAFSSLNKLRSHNPSDKRVWVPLYLLMREYSNDDDMRAYLEEVVPLIAQAPRALRSYPVTFESLQTELTRLSGESREDDADDELVEAMDLPAAAGAEPTVGSQRGTRPFKVTKPTASLAELLKPEQSSEGRTSAQGLGTNGKEKEKAAEGIEHYQVDPASFSVPQVKPLDWRECVRERKIPDGFATKVLNSAFSSATEKHVAIQVAALMTGDMSILNDWHWKIWRAPEQYGYSRSGKDRFPAGSNPDLLYSPLHRAIIYLAPALVKRYNHRFRKKYLARRLSVAEADLSTVVHPLEWDHPLFRNSALVHYLETIRRQKFKIFNASGLRSKIFYEGENRSLYVDADYYLKKPSSMIFHRIYGILWSIKLRYFVPLHLDPTRHLFNGYTEMHKAIGEGSLGWVKNVVRGGQDPVQSALATVDKAELKRQMERVGEVSSDTMKELWTTMQDHIHRLLLAETLDVIGLFEAISGHDYIEGRALEPLQILEDSHYFAGLLDYLTQLKI